MNITIEIGGPMAEAINNLAAALSTTNIIEKVRKESSEPKPEPTKEEPKKPAPRAKKAQVEEPAQQEVPTQKELRAMADAVADKKGLSIVKEILVENFKVGKLADLSDHDRLKVAEIFKALL